MRVCVSNTRVSEFMCEINTRVVCTQVTACVGDYLMDDCFGRVQLLGIRAGDDLYIRKADGTCQKRTSGHCNIERTQQSARGASAPTLITAPVDPSESTVPAGTIATATPTTKGVTVTPAMTVPVDPVETPAILRRRGGSGPEPAAPYIPGSGALSDPFQKNYNKDSKRSVTREFNPVKYGARARRKANAVDHFFAVAQGERNRMHGGRQATTSQLESSFGTPMPEQKRYRYRGHTSCNLLQEILMTLMWYRCAYSFDDLASKWLNGCTPVLRRAANNICITWTGFFYAILSVEPMWISPERADMIRPPAFSGAVADNVGHLSDCTNLDMGNCQRSNPLASSLLISNYYQGICVKYLIDISRCGGVCAVSETHGGGKACDERHMESAGYFDPSICQWRYKVCPRCDSSKDKHCKHKLRHGFFYDGGVDMATVGRCDSCGCRCVKTGFKRTDGSSTLSSVGRSMGNDKSVLRIRVENKIGDSKNRSKLIGGRNLTIHHLAHTHKIVYIIYAMMNFNGPTIV